MSYPNPFRYCLLACIERSSLCAIRLESGQKLSCERRRREQPEPGFGAQAA
jgi:hypothetical protein